LCHLDHRKVFERLSFAIASLCVGTFCVLCNSV